MPDSSARHLPGLEPVVRDPADIALPAIEQHEPIATYALVSGGHDSAAVARWAVAAVGAAMTRTTPIGPYDRGAA